MSNFKKSEKQRLIENAYKRKLELLSFKSFDIDFMNIKNGFCPLAFQYDVIQYTKYYRVTMIVFNLALIINLKYKE